MADCLKYGRPETVGVRPDWICDYVNEVEKRGLMCHSFAMVRHGQVFAQGYWKPFTADRLHRMYSVSKSFVSAAIGILCDEGRIHLDDRIVDYFPEQLPEHPESYILETTIRDMLMMATGHKCSTYGFVDMDWLKTFFQPHRPADHPPGMIFNYDTSASYVLDVLVERLTGKPYLEYLKDKMLRELGFSEDAWCVQAPEGYAWGGSGVECTTLDLARFALVFLNGGCVNGKQYISKEYVKAATSRQIDNGPSGHLDALHGHGYGYQIWMTKEGSFSFLGMGGQLAICVPQKDLLFVCTSDTQGRGTGYVEIFESFWHHIVERVEEEQLPMEDEAYKALQQKLEKLSCILPEGVASSPMAEEINGVTYQLNPNHMCIKTVRFELNGNKGVLYYNTDRGAKQLDFAFGQYEEGEFPENHYSGKRINHPKGSGYHCMTAAGWTEPHKLVLRCYIIDDYFGNLTATFAFKGKQIGVRMMKTAENFLNEYEGFAGGERL